MVGAALGRIEGRASWTRGLPSRRQSFSSYCSYHPLHRGLGNGAFHLLPPGRRRRWWARQDLNLQGVLHWILSPARLPFRHVPDDASGIVLSPFSHVKQRHAGTLSLLALVELAPQTTSRLAANRGFTADSRRPPARPPFPCSRVAIILSSPPGWAAPSSFGARTTPA